MAPSRLGERHHSSWREIPFAPPIACRSTLTAKGRAILPQQSRLVYSPLRDQAGAMIGLQDLSLEVRTEYS